MLGYSPITFCRPGQIYFSRPGLAENTIFHYCYLNMNNKLAVMFLIGAAALAAEVQRDQPRFANGNQLIRPVGYREWMFVGTGLGMSYSKGPGDKNPTFANIYIQPEAYRRFAAAGEFPDKTLLVMEVVSAGSRASINQQGQFEDRFMGIEAAVKDEKRFAEKWAYFSFIGQGGEPLAQAKPFPKEACWQCHHAHGAVDNVFVQFYPVLREAAKSSRERQAPPPR